MDITVIESKSHDIDLLIYSNHMFLRGQIGAFVWELLRVAKWPIHTLLRIKPQLELTRSPF